MEVLAWRAFWKFWRGGHFGAGLSEHESDQRFPPYPSHTGFAANLKRIFSVAITVNLQSTGLVFQLNIPEMQWTQSISPSRSA